MGEKWRSWAKTTPQDPSKFSDATTPRCATHREDSPGHDAAYAKIAGGK